MKLTPAPGNHIDAVCQEACAVMAQFGQPAEFTFNGTRVIGQPGDTPDTLRGRWDKLGDAAVRAYCKTPEYAAAKVQDKRRTVRLQERLRQCVRRLPRAVRGGERSIIEWCKEFVPLNDWTFTHCDAWSLAGRLLEAGYTPGDCVDHREVRTDLRVMARWIIGQVLSGLVHEAGVIHPIMATFAAQYLRRAGSVGRQYEFDWDDHDGFVHCDCGQWNDENSRFCEQCHHEL